MDARTVASPDNDRLPKTAVCSCHDEESEAKPADRVGENELAGDEASEYDAAELLPDMVNDCDGEMVMDMGGRFEYVVEADDGMPSYDDVEPEKLGLELLPSRAPRFEMGTP